MQQCATLQLQQPILRSNTGKPTSRPASWHICSLWNEENYAFPGTCMYRHICMQCLQHSHPARECRLAARSRQTVGSTRVPTTSSCLWWSKSISGSSPRLAPHSFSHIYCIGCWACLASCSIVTLYCCCHLLLLLVSKTS